MGGSSKLSYCSKCKEPLNCDICTYKGHRSALCPFLYTECPAVGCKGYRKIIKSNTTENPDRLFLKCQSPKCGSFQWLDEAVDKCYSPGSSSKSPKPHRNNCCFKCGEPDHWVHDCPWTHLGCQEKDCTGVLTISKSSASADEFLDYSSVIVAKQLSYSVKLKWLERSIPLHQFLALKHYINYV